MFYDAPMTQSVAPVGHKNQKLVFPDTVIRTYDNPVVINSTDTDTSRMWAIAAQVEGAVNPTGLNNIVSPDVDYLAVENNRLGCIAMPIGDSTAMYIA